MATATQLLTYEEWLQMPVVEDGTDEVVNGVLHFMAPTRYPHGEIIQRLGRRVDRQIDEQRVGLLGSNLGLMISREPLTCRSPDLILFWRDKMEIRDGLYYSAPGLVVEVISPSEDRRRKEGKMADYARIGVPEAWLCDPTAKTLEVRRLKSGGVQVLSDGVVEPEEFPGVRVSVAEIWP